MTSPPQDLGPLSHKVQIITLPITQDFLRQKRHIEDRGELALIEDGMPIHHLAYFSLQPNQGYRGGHVHHRKTEHFYIISGVLHLDLEDTATGDKRRIRLEPGHKVRIQPGCAHRFEAVETAQVIEYYEGVYDQEDDIPHGF